MTTDRAEIMLIDLSSIAYPIWHMSQTEPDPNWTSTQTVARVRALASGRPHVAVCCDSGRSFRHEITPTYKATRPEHDAPRQHQIATAIEALKADGFLILAAKGFEADDVIASATAWAVMTEHDALIVTADKDLLQLVGDHVRAMRLKDGTILSASDVAAKFGVLPSQMRDYLTLVGDSSDNIIGAKGIGPKRAADLLKEFDSLDALYAKLETTGGATLGLTPSVSLSLREFKASGAMELARSLVALRTDVDLPFADVLKDRQPQGGDFETGLEEDYEEESDAAPIVGPAAFDQAHGLDPRGAVRLNAPATPSDAVTAKGSAPSLPSTDAAVPAQSTGDSGHSQALAVRDAEVLPAPEQWERQLDPRSMREAKSLATDMYQSRLFSAYGTPAAVLSTVMLGRELGLPAMASLRGVHVIEGRHAISAHLMVALILKSGMAEYFRPVTFSDQEATYETLRKGPGNKPITIQHTIKMAETAGLLKPKSNWLTVPIDMLCARASSRLARMVYPDLIGGLYTPDELSEKGAE